MRKVLGATGVVGTAAGAEPVNGGREVSATTTPSSNASGSAELSASHFRGGSRSHGPENGSEAQRRAPGVRPVDHPGHHRGGVRVRRGPPSVGGAVAARLALIWLLTLPAAATVGALAAWVAARGTTGTVLVAAVLIAAAAIIYALS